MRGIHPAGTRVRKIDSEEGDGHVDGDLGVLVDTIFTGYEVDPGNGQPTEWTFCVIWDDMPNLPVHTIGRKLEPVVD